MRIKQIEINGLFGMFDHIVPLNLTEHITIIYGINGIGKTMLFKILDSFFNSNFSKLVGFPFDNLIIEFDNKEAIKFLIRVKKFFIEFKINIEKKEALIRYDLSNYKTSKQLDSNINSKLNQLPVSPSLETKELSLEERLILKSRINNLLPNINLYFIQTQRLWNFNIQSKVEESNHKYGNAKELNETYKIDTVKNYSLELSELIQTKHREYAKQSEEFELSLGKRLKNKEVKIYSDPEELKKENKVLEAKRNELKSVGLFEDIKEDYSNIPDTIDEIERAVLSVNIQDMKNKLKIFDELYEKLKIFLNVLNNKRFSYKKISIHPKKGFVFKNDNGKPLEVTELSSGEQHEIVLFYELLFKVPENSLVLIDEPEISLHVVWQKEFLTDLEDIVKIRNFDILLATHSPSIINGNWDLTVELNKDKNDEK